MIGTVGLLAFLSAQVDMVRVGRLFRELRPSTAFAGLALYALLQTVRAGRYRLLAPDASARLLLSVHCVHALLLRVMPFRTGELGFAWLMRRHGPGGFGRHLVGVLLLRVLDLATILGVLMLGLVLWAATRTADDPTSWPLAVAIACVALAAPLYLRSLVRWGHRLASLVLALTRLDRLARVRRAQRGLSDAVDWSDSLRPRTLWAVSGLTVTQWVLNFVLFGVMLHAMHVPATVGQTILGGAGSVLGGLVPLASIGNFGPLEAGWSAGFTAAGLPAETAIASAFGFSVLSFGYALATALVGWLALPRHVATKRLLNDDGTARNPDAR
ncbi:MAG TPA: lysylphosphatidylglycerol synthase transmembrane domain-containing protein [Sandaracinaceae bacterium LLY-WYZ-13_1]|nr:lysylphosphatidylglycerol synthase transmembrane domain-containing protein [Sandaracinaceae bacterium LLY-WYZ-13_1]